MAALVKGQEGSGFLFAPLYNLPVLFRRASDRECKIREALAIPWK